MSMLPIWTFKRLESETITTDDDAYTAGDVVGGLITFTDFAKNREGDKSGGYVSDVWLSDAANQGTSLVLYLFDAVPATIADDAAFTLSVDDSLKCFARIPITSYSDVLKTGGGTIKWAHVDSLQHEFQPGDGNIYGYLVGAPNYGTTDAVRIVLGGFTY